MAGIKWEHELCNHLQDECRTGLECRQAKQHPDIYTCERMTHGIELNGRCTEDDQCQSMYCAKPDCDKGNPYKSIGLDTEKCKNIGGKCQLRSMNASRLDYDPIR